KVVLLALLFAGLGGCAIASPPLKTARLVSRSQPILIHTGMAMTPVVEPAWALTFGFAFCQIELRPNTFPPSLLDSERVLGLCLNVTNTGDRAILVDWNTSALTFEGRTGPVLHRNVPFVQRSLPRSASAVPPPTTLSDFVYPSDLIAFLGEKWRGPKVFETMPPRRRFSLFISMRRGGDVIEREFLFEMQAETEQTGR